MSRTRLELLQWFGFLAGGGAWAVSLVLGYGMTLADCSAGGRSWGSARSSYQLPLTAVALTIAVLAELAAFTVYRDLEQVHDDAPGPRGRLHFFAVAALIGNVLFAVAIVLGGVGVFAGATCRQS
jgi:hypothetical protein